MPISQKTALARQNELICWQMKEKGYTDQEISDFLGVDVSSVRAMLRRVEKRVISQTNDIALAVKVRLTKQLETIQSEALRAWEASKSEKTETTVTDTDATNQKGKKKVKVVQKKSQRDGNPEYLEVALNSMEKIARLWGVGTDTSHPTEDGLPKIQAIQINMVTNGSGHVVGQAKALPGDVVDAETQDLGQEANNANSDAK